MNIKVQRQKPNRGEGSQGEMRLVMMGRGSGLYIKGRNQWHILSLKPSEEVNQSDRRARGDLQRNILTVTDSDDNGSFDGNGAILDPSGKGDGAALPDAPL